MTQLPVSAIHPAAQDHLAFTAVFSAPIDVAAVIDRLADKSGAPVAFGISSPNPDGTMREIDPGRAENANGPLIFHYVCDGITVLITPVPLPLQGDMHLPEHSFHLQITMLTSGSHERRAAGARRFAAGAGGPADPNGTASVPATNEEALEWRAEMRELFGVYTSLVRALMAEDAALAVVRQEIGIAFPAHVITGFELASPVPYLLWIYVPVVHGDLRYGRTRGLPLFGHLDVQISGSAKSAEQVYDLLVNTAGYVIENGGTLMPGQTLEAPGVGAVVISQAKDPETGEDLLELKF